MSKVLRSGTPRSVLGFRGQGIAGEVQDGALTSLLGEIAVDRRTFLAGAASTALIAGVQGPTAMAQTAGSVNLAKVAIPMSLYTSGDTSLSALNDGIEPRNSQDRERGAYGNWPNLNTQWVQYAWSKPVSTNKIDVYWWIDHSGVGAPASYRVLYWDGSAFVPVKNADGLRVMPDRYNTTSFDEIRTTRIRLELMSDGTHSTGILEWKVYNSGEVPAFPPIVDAGLDRVVILGGRTYLSGRAEWLRPAPDDSVQWAKVSGPGEVAFENANVPVTTATFTAPGEYLLKLTASGRGEAMSSHVAVRAEAPPPKQRLDVVYTTRYSMDSPFWSARAKALIVNWIPHCIAYCERTDLRQGEGGLDNFQEAAKALQGEPHAGHKGYVFSNAWVHQTVESMCLAMMVEAQGDAEILAAQAKMKDTLERWIPVILAAQMPDGYLQTAYVLADRKVWPERWSAEHRGNHEGYVSGYFIESAINHYTLTDGQDLRLYNAAKRLADCWVANIGPGKKDWFDGHQEMEQALVRFGRFVNDMEGQGRGDSYIVLAKFLLDSRRGGQEYDQSHLPPGKQYEAVGHAVRATYFYSGMADIAAETGDRDYQSAVMSLWDNMVNRKYYLTGGIGSGETSEGFGPNYSLRNEAYCESCSSCGLIFFQYKLNLAYHDAKFADLYEQTMYNALLGGVALDGKSFCYTNPLINTQRTIWHVCPCCVGNIPRTLLMMPTWTYAKGPGALYVNLFVGSRMRVGTIDGTGVEIVQKTNYPWSGKVEITINPEATKNFSLHVRVPDRSTSRLYTTLPSVNGLETLTVNGRAMKPKIEKGYVVITRAWRAGDRVQLEMPMVPQRVAADHRIQADTGDVALKYGPLVYNVETADAQDIEGALSKKPIEAEWRPDLLDGVMVLTGTWGDGSKMTAIPNYARMNRVSPPVEFLGDPTVNYAPGANNGPGAKPSASTAAATMSTTAGSSKRIFDGVGQAGRVRQEMPIKVDSQVWMREQADVT